MRIVDPVARIEPKGAALKLVLKGNLIMLLALLVLSIFVLPLSNTERVLLSVFFALLTGFNWALLQGLSERKDRNGD